MPYVFLEEFQNHAQPPYPNVLSFPKELTRITYPALLHSIVAANKPTHGYKAYNPVKVSSPATQLF
jgi:hypothetical protein